MKSQKQTTKIQKLPKPFQIVPAVEILNMKASGERVSVPKLAGYVDVKLTDDEGEKYCC